MTVGVKQHRGKWQVDLRSHYVGVYSEKRTADAIFGHGEHLVMLGRPLHDVIDELRGRTAAGPAPRLSERTEAWLARRTVDPDTLAKYRSRLKRADAVMPLRLDLVTRDDVADLISDLSARYSPNSVRDTMALLRAVFADAVMASLIPSNPCDRPDNMPRLRRMREPHALTRAEYAALVKAAPGYFTPLVALLPLTGLRISEACGLEWRDVDLRARTLKVARQFSRGRVRSRTKTDAGMRTLDLTPHAVDWLQMQRGLIPANITLVFPGMRGSHLRYDAVSDLFVTLRADTGIDVRPHDLRHTFGSWMLRSGCDIVRVSAMMGHSNPSFTLRVYAHEIAETDSTSVANLEQWVSRGQNGDRNDT